MLQVFFGLIAGLLVGLVMEWIVDWQVLTPRQWGGATRRSTEEVQRHLAGNAQPKSAPRVPQDASAPAEPNSSAHGE
jgi:hypothetical protein